MLKEFELSPKEVKTCEEALKKVNPLWRDLRRPKVKQAQELLIQVVGEKVSAGMAVGLPRLQQARAVELDYYNKRKAAVAARFDHHSVHWVVRRGPHFQAKRKLQVKKGMGKKKPSPAQSNPGAGRKKTATGTGIAGSKLLPMRVSSRGSGRGGTKTGSGKSKRLVIKGAGKSRARPVKPRKSALQHTGEHRSGIIISESSPCWDALFFGLIFAHAERSWGVSLKEELGSPQRFYERFILAEKEVLDDVWSLAEQFITAAWLRVEN